MTIKVELICTAYEKGYSDGIGNIPNKNPYPGCARSQEFKAYNIGYAAGVTAKEELFGVELSGKD